MVDLDVIDARKLLFNQILNRHYIAIRKGFYLRLLSRLEHRPLGLGSISPTDGLQWRQPGISESLLTFGDQALRGRDSSLISE